MNFFILFYASIYLFFDINSRIEGKIDWELTYHINIGSLVVLTIIDIIKGFVTSIYVEGVLIEDEKEIAKEYTRAKFWMDIISLFSILVNRSFFSFIAPEIIYAINFLFFLKFHIIISVLGKLE